MPFHIHFLSLSITYDYLSLILSHCSFPLFLFLSPRLIRQGYIIFVLLLLLPPPPCTQPLSQSRATRGRKYGGGQASHGIIQLTYPETSVCVCFLCLLLIGSLLCVNLCSFVCVCVQMCVCSFGLWITEWSLWLLERSTVIKLPLFQKSSCDCVMTPSFLLSLPPTKLHSPTHPSSHLSLHLRHSDVTSIIIALHPLNLPTPNIPRIVSVVFR